MTDNLHLGDQGCHPNRQKREHKGKDWQRLESISSLSTNEAFCLSMIMQAYIVHVG